MGSGKRKRKRKEYMKRLSRVDSDKFVREWRKRLESWLHEMKQDIIYFRNQKNLRPSLIHDRIKEILVELRSYGSSAVELEYDNTVNLLSTFYFETYADLFGRHLYRLRISMNT